jgi:biopolymer transport protein ExbB/TolQ
MQSVESIAVELKAARQELSGVESQRNKCLKEWAESRDRLAKNKAAPGAMHEFQRLTALLQEQEASLEKRAQKVRSLMAQQEQARTRPSQAFLQHRYGEPYR